MRVPREVLQGGKGNGQKANAERGEGVEYDGR